MRVPTAVSVPPRRSQVKLSKIRNVSNHITGSIQLGIRQSQRGYHSITSPLRRTQLDKDHLIFIVIDDVIQSSFQFNLFRRIQVALENRILQMIAKISTGDKHLPQPLGIGDVVTNQVGSAHGEREKGKGKRNNGERENGEKEKFSNSR